ncbi:hypothetical protein PUNSTDRAFT_135710 [Punctularia strigosozonata HHB-11173 SS5]|uniref:uncharacterized protein n=1 Tax=Punctularia strigosozonata (strain HHB-11173) TaxID=741275 RepID=UPI0004417A86|nr:uncharacterized protein PUNSTDRAFT_135710 [Punctularia strigosozonata HHB-11173 SS5]EIN07012.1 hypothetical protein PUNSTDRAFT_135710 [Punctularia strigosozonata HHB-11173 SS5]
MSTATASSRANPAPGNLKERIAALQQRSTSPPAQPSSPPLNGLAPKSPTGSNVPASPSTNSLRDKIARFEQRGGTPVPRGRFGMGVPPVAPSGASQKKGMLYGNRVEGLGRPHHIPTLQRNVSSAGKVQKSSVMESKRRVASESALTSPVIAAEGTQEVTPGALAGEPMPAVLESPSPSIPVGAPEEAGAVPALQVLVDSAATEVGAPSAPSDDPPSPASTTTIQATALLEPVSLPPAHSDPGDATAPVPNTASPLEQVVPEPDAELSTISSPTSAEPALALVQAMPVQGDSAPPTQSSPRKTPSPVHSPRESRPPNLPMPAPSVPTPSTAASLPSTPGTAGSTASDMSTESDISDAEIITQPQLLRISPKPSRATLVSTPISRKNSASAGDFVQDEFIASPASTTSQTPTPIATEPGAQASVAAAPPPEKEKPASAPAAAAAPVQPRKSSFTAVVHRKETVKVPAPSTPARSRTYGPSSSSQVVYAPTQSTAEPPSPSPGGDLADLLADAAFLEHQLELGGYFSPRKDVFSSSAGLAGTLGASAADTNSDAKAHNRNLSVQTIKADPPSQSDKAKDKAPKDKLGSLSSSAMETPPPTPPPKSPDSRLFSSLRSLRKRASTAYPRDSIASELSTSTTDESAALQTPNSYDELGVLVTPPQQGHGSLASGRPSSVFKDDASVASSRWSLKSSTSSPRKGIGRATSFAGKMFGKSKSRTPSIRTMDSRDELRPRASSPAPSLRLLDLDISSSSLSPVADGEHASRRESWMSSTTSSLSSPGFDQELFDAFPSVPSTATSSGTQGRGTLALDTSNLPASKYGQTDGGTTLLTPPSRSSSLMGLGFHQKHATSPS